MPTPVGKDSMNPQQSRTLIDLDQMGKVSLARAHGFASEINHFKE
jgi:hypothetical protein